MVAYTYGSVFHVSVRIGELSDLEPRFHMNPLAGLAQLPGRILWSVHSYGLLTKCKGPGKRGHIVADTNVSPFAHAHNICCRHKFCVRDTKKCSDFVQNILCPQQMFPSLRSLGDIMGNNVSTTMCRLPGP